MFFFSPGSTSTTCRSQNQKGLVGGSGLPRGPSSISRVSRARSLFPLLQQDTRTHMGGGACGCKSSATKASLCLHPRTRKGPGHQGCITQEGPRSPAQPCANRPAFRRRRDWSPGPCTQGVSSVLRATAPFSGLHHLYGGPGML